MLSVLDEVQLRRSCFINVAYIWSVYIVTHTISSVDVIYYVCVAENYVLTNKQDSSMYETIAAIIVIQRCNVLDAYVYHRYMITYIMRKQAAA